MVVGVLREKLHADSSNRVVIVLGPPSARIRGNGVMVVVVEVVPT